LECWESVSLRSSYHSGLRGMFDLVSRGEELLTLVIVAWHRMQHPLSASQTTVGLPCPKPPCHDFSTLAK
jgi:hypothetical protein